MITLQLHKLLLLFQIVTIEIIENIDRSSILDAGFSMFPEFTAGSVVIIEYQVSSIKYQTLWGRLFRINPDYY